MILINSGAYVITEIEEEYGKIPPCFLPIANKSLLTYQIKCLKKSFPNEKIYLSLPNDFDLSIINLEFIKKNNITIVRTNSNCSLKKSILQVLKKINRNINEDIKMLHGDNLLLEKISNKKDIIGIVPRRELYNTHEVINIKNKEFIWSGYFNFSKKKLLIKCLTKSNSFVNAIKIYSSKKKLNYSLQKKWFDLGHVNTYFKSRSSIISSRHFNTIKVSKNVIVKSSLDKIKVKSEYLWFKNLPKNLKKYTPKLIEFNEFKKISQYSIEYLPLNPLNEIFVYGKNPILFWEKVFSIINILLKDFRNIKKINNQIIKKNSIWLIENKSNTRLKLLSNFNLIDINHNYFYKNRKMPSLSEITKFCISKSKKNRFLPAVIHGDLCLSNILFNSRINSIKIIDPRGIGYNNNLTIYGDQNYDLAKLTHSIVGMYDHIISGQYTLINFNLKSMEIKFEKSVRLKNIQRLFIKKIIGNKKFKDILPQVILLFINMLPLHKDKKDIQKAIFANCLRLYSLYQK